MYFDRDFIEGLKEKRDLNAVTLDEIKEYGYGVFQEIYTNEVGQEIKIEIYELNYKTYLTRFVDGKCVQFIDITTKRQ